MQFSVFHTLKLDQAAVRRSPEPGPPEHLDLDPLPGLFGREEVWPTESRMTR